MNYGLYLSASGVLTNMYRQDVYANNLANAQTIGYKPDYPAIQLRQPEAIEDNAGLELREDLLDRIGGGAFAGPQAINFGVGRLEPTGNPMDVALSEPDRFFAVARTDPRTQQREVLLTRDGRFVRDAAGLLVTASGGHEVLDAQDSPIPLGDGPVQIDSAGNIQQDGEAIGRLQVASVDDLRALKKAGQNLCSLEGARRRPVDEARAVVSGFLEGSNVEPVHELVKLIEATRAISMNSQMIQYHDGLMDRAVNVLGRVLA